MKTIVLKLSVIILIFGSCKHFADRSYDIRIRNTSDINIDCYAAYILPDTLLPLEKPEFIEVKPGESGFIYGYNINDPGLERFNTERLSIFVLSKDTVESYSWEEIRSDYQILKRYEINEQDLINMGGSVTYP